MSSTPHFGPGPDLRGQLIVGRYRLDGWIAWVGMAMVYSAVDLRLDRPVAVQMISSECLRTGDQRRRVLQAAQLRAKLDHPHVMPVFDLGEEVMPGGERRMYLIMPLIAGVSLREVILGGQLSWLRAADLTSQILRGVGALHRRGALHRDIRPENCLVGRSDGLEQLRLADLGIVDVAISDRLFSSHTAAFAYVSPEQVQEFALDERADLYSVGVILYELLTGRVPFIGKYLRVLNAHVGTPPLPPHVLVPAAGIPASIEAVVLRALAKNPDQRYETAEQFAAALAVATEVGMNAAENKRSTRPRCPVDHAGCEAAVASLAAWTRFDYTLAFKEATRATQANRSWSPLRLLMSDLPDDPR